MAGKLSVTTAPVTSLGPELVTAIVKVSFWPATAVLVSSATLTLMRRSGSLLLSWRSAHCQRCRSNHGVKGWVGRILCPKLNERGIVGRSYVERS